MSWSNSVNKLIHMQNPSPRTPCTFFGYLEKKCSLTKKEKFNLKNIYIKAVDSYTSRVLEVFKTGLKGYLQRFANFFQKINRVLPIEKRHIYNKSLILWA